MEKVNLYHGDCLEVIKELMENEVKVDCVITDPPYLHEKGGRGKMLLGDSLDREKFNMKKLGDFGKNEIYGFLDATKHLMQKPQWYIFCSEKQIVYYLNWCVENKFKYNILTWNKPLSVMNRERYSTNIEYIVRIYTVGCALNKLDLENNKEKTYYYSKYKTYNQVRGKGKIHPSQKPTPLLNELIELSVKEEGIVLDCFMGSGSTGVACANTNRKFIGIELEENYFNIAKERIENTYKQIENNEEK